MHNGMLRFTGEKMSKSLGNVVTLREALDDWGRETLLLLFFMTAHWRKPIDFSDETMEAAQAQADTLPERVRRRGGFGRATGKRSSVLDDDFNTPEALALLHEWRRASQLDLLRRGLELFGLGRWRSRGGAPAEVVALAERAQAARDARDFARRTELRIEIDALGWEVRDVAGGFRLVPK